MARLDWPYTSQALSTTAETELLELFATFGTGYRGMTFAVYSSAVAGTATLKYVEPGGGERILTTMTIPAGGNDGTVIDLDFSMPQVKLYVTMDSGSATTLTAEGMIY